MGEEEDDDREEKAVHGGEEHVDRRRKSVERGDGRADDRGHDHGRGAALWAPFMFLEGHVARPRVSDAALEEADDAARE